MFLASDGGGTSSGPTFTGTQTLQIEPRAIPDALRAFEEAHRRVAAKVQELGSLEVRNWAQDEVSSETAVRFSDRTNGGGSDSALACLLGYEKQLRAACAALAAAKADYTAMEGANHERWGSYDS